MNTNLILWNKICLLLTTVFLFAVPAYGMNEPSSPRIRGKLVDAGNRQAIDFADILVFEKGNDQPVAHTYPGEDGSFRIDGLGDGEYTLMIRLIGYDLYSRDHIVLNGGTTPLDVGVIGMKPLEVGLAEVEVVAQKKQIIYKLDKKVIDAASNLMAGGGTAVDILENTPSIRVDAEGEVTFRGSSGFLVYVDGKPSIFTGTQALEQIPSSHIENIEIITTPSARHDTEGDVGIINIITKKETRDGLSGMVNVTGSTVLTYGVDFLINNRKNNFSWYAGGGWEERLRKSNFEQQKTTLVADTTTLSHSKGPRKSNRYNFNLKTGGVYLFPRTTLTYDLEGGQSGTKRKGDLDYREERSEGGKIFHQGTYDSRDDYHLYQTNFLGSVGADHKFNDNGHKISALFYLKHEANAMEYFESELYDKNGVRQQGHKAWEDEIRWTVRANLDYIWPYRAGGQLEAGYQYFSYLEDGDYSMQFYNPEIKEFYWRDDIYNTFYFQRGINSFYAIIGESFRNFELQAGVRAEHTHRVLRSSIEGADRLFNRFEFFPSVHAGYHFPHRHTVMASYSRRTTRPQLFYMEPYITYRDYYSAEIGNPDIRPEYINSYEFNYKKNFDEHSVSATVFHRKRKDKIERLRIPFEAGVTLDSMANVGHDFATGLEAALQVQPFRFWNININGSVYHYKVENEFKLGSGDEKSTNYDIAWNNGFGIGKYTRVQLDGNFVGPSVTTQGRTDAFWYVNLAVRQQSRNRKLTGTLSFRDIFNSARYNSRIHRSDLISITKIRPSYPLITLSLSYTFNSFNIRSSQSRETHDLFEGTNH